MVGRARVVVFLELGPRMTDARGEGVDDRLPSQRILFGEMNLNGNGGGPNFPAEISTWQRRAYQDGCSCAWPGCGQQLSAGATVGEAGINQFVGKAGDGSLAARKHLVKPEFLDLADGARGVLEELPIVQIRSV